MNGKKIKIYDELDNRSTGEVAASAFEDIVRNSAMTNEAEIIRMIHEKIKEIEYMLGVLSVMAKTNPPE